METSGQLQAWALFAKCTSNHGGVPLSNEAMRPLRNNNPIHAIPTPHATESSQQSQSQAVVLHRYVKPVPLDVIRACGGLPLNGQLDTGAADSDGVNGSVAYGNGSHAHFVDRAGPGGGEEFYNPYDEDEVVEDIYFEPRQYEAYVRKWLLAVPEPPRVTLVGRHWEHDYDTETGRPIQLDYPDTRPCFPCLSNGIPDVLATWKQCNYTVNYRIRAQRDYLARESDKRELQKAVMKTLCGNHDDQQGRLVEERPKIPVEGGVLLRPATPDDLEAVTEIYNMEVTGGNQAHHIDPVGEEYFRKVGMCCEQQKFPFVVAISREDELDVGSLSAKDQGLYAEFKRWKKAHAPAPPRNHVIGFAYLSEYSPGRTKNRFSAALHLFVHTEFRGRHVGSALLDRMVSFSSSMWLRQDGYSWECTSGNPVYADQADNAARNLHRLFVIGQYKHSGGQSTDQDPTLKWHSTWLSKYIFEKSATIECASRDRDGDWLDEVIWSHVARDTRELTRNRTGQVVAEF